MKYILILLSFFFCLSANAQIRYVGTVGRQQEYVYEYQTVPFDTCNTLIWLPRDYDSTTTSYPLLICLGGNDQTGRNINKLLGATWPANLINKGYNMEFTNPKDGKLYKFIVFTPECPTAWALQEVHLKYLLPQLEAKYRIDTNRIYVTGLSAGGYGTWTCVTDDTSFTKKIAAIVPVSAASIESYRVPNILNAIKFNLPIWDICGTADGFYGDNLKYIDTLYAHSPVTPPDSTWIPGVGHSAWNQAYDSSWKVGGMNTYEWMLQYTRATMLSMPLIDTTSTVPDTIVSTPVPVDTTVVVTPPKVVLPALSSILDTLNCKLDGNTLSFTKGGLPYLKIVFPTTLKIYNSFNGFTTPTNITTTTYK